MSNAQLTLLFAALGIASLTAGLLIRAGRLRWWLQTYWDTSLPSAQRAGGLILLPAGVIILTGVVGVILEAAGLRPFGLLLGFAALAAFIVLMPLVWSRPLSWTKPTWLRELEARAAADPALRAQLAESHRQRSSPRDYRAAWIVLIALGIASVVFAWALSGCSSPSLVVTACHSIDRGVFAQGPVALDVLPLREPLTYTVGPGGAAQRATLVPTWPSISELSHGQYHAMSGRRR